MSHLDRTIAPEVSEYGQLQFPHPIQTDVATICGGMVRIMSFNRCPEPVCRVTVAWPVGLMDCDRLSVAAIASAALKEGTLTHDASEISTLLESNGAWLAVETLQEYTLLHLYALNRRLRPVLEILQDIIVNPIFPEQRIEALRLRQAESARQNKCKVSYMADYALRRLMTGKDHLRSRMLIAEDIEAVENSDLNDYWQNLTSTYAPTVWIAGNITDSVMNTVMSFASALPVKNNSKKAVEPKPIYKPEQVTSVVTKIKDVKQAAIAMGMNVPGPSHCDHMLLRMAVTALGGYFGSRLNTNIREDKGLTYGIGASLRMSSQGTYLFIQSQADESFISQVVEETKNEIRSLWQNPVSLEEKIAITRNTQSRLAGMLDSPFTTLDYCLAMQQTGVDIDFFNRTQAALDFTAEEIAKVAERHLNPDKLSVSIARKA